LAEHAGIAQQRLAPRDADATEMLPVAMTGSVFRQSRHVRMVFYNALQPRFPGIHVCQELVDPVEGALARARRIETGLAPPEAG